MVRGGLYRTGHLYIICRSCCIRTTSWLYLLSMWKQGYFQFLIKGHFIGVCPTLGDENFDKPKLKRTTGIPKTFLKTVDQRDAGVRFKK